MKKFLLVMLPVLALIAYLGVIWINEDETAGNMFINGQKYQFMTASEVAETMSENYDLGYVWIRRWDEEGLRETDLFSIDLMDFCTVSFSADDVRKANEEISFLQRALFFAYKFEKTIEPNIWINQNALREYIASHNGSTKPEDAYVTYDYGKSAYAVAPQKDSDIFDVDAIVDDIVAYIRSDEPKDYDINIESLFLKPSVTQADERLIAKAKELNKEFDFTITYNMPDGNVMVDKNTIHDWYKLDEHGIPVNEDGRYVVSFNAVFEFVEDMADEADIFKAGYDFQTTNNGQIHIATGSYGYKLDDAWEIDMLISELHDRENVERSPMWKSEAFYYGGIGDTYVEVSLDEQHLWYYVNGEVFMETDVVTGNYGNRDTTKGVWYVMSKTAGKWLTGPTWRSWVDYWMPFNEYAEGLHDASWRSRFGGNIYKGDGSHGCVNLPKAFAKELFSVIKTGTPVIVY